MMDKKGMEMWGTIGKAILVAIIVVVILAIFIPKTNLFAKDINSNIVQYQYELCKEKTKAMKESTILNKPVTDIDEDGLFDVNCDNCVCPKDQGCNNEKDDADGDKIPVKCDKNDKKDGGSLYEFNDGCMKLIKQRTDKKMICVFS